MNSCLKSMGQEFDKTVTQSSFAALGVFFLGLTIFGLKHTIKATDRRTSRYFRAMMLVPSSIKLCLLPNNFRVDWMNLFSGNRSLNTQLSVKVNPLGYDLTTLTVTESSELT
jgi:hypothetical protein